MAPLSDDVHPASILGSSDDLSDHYAKLAASATSAAEKEAAMQFVIAESHIKEGEAFEDALRSANKALSFFRNIRSSVGVADSQRLIIHAYCLKAALLQEHLPRRKEADLTLKQAEEIAVENAAAFRQMGDKRSEAAMLLSSAEVKFQIGSTAKRKEAAAAAIESQARCKDCGDKRLEGAAVLFRCQLHLSLNKGQEAVRAALDARLLFKAAHDSFGMAKAVRALGMARASIGELVEAIGAMKQAETMYRDLGLQQETTVALFHIARLSLQNGDFEESGRYIEQIDKVMVDAKNSGDDSYAAWPVFVKGLEAKLLAAAGQHNEAAALVDEIKNSLQAGDMKSHLVAVRVDAQVQFEAGSIDNAIQAIQNGLKLCLNAGGSETWEANLMFLAAEMLSSSERPVDGVAWSAKAREQYRKIGDKQGEAKSTLLLAQEHLKKKDPLVALKTCQQGRTLAIKSEQRQVEASLLFFAAKAHLSIGEEEEGMASTQEAASIYAELADLRGEMEALKLAAAIFKANDEYHEAEDVARKSQGKARDLGDKVSEVQILRWQANLHAEHGYTKAALRAAKDALRVGKSQDKKSQVETLLLVSERYLAHLQAEAEQQPDPAKLIISKASLVMKPGNEAVQMAKDVGDKSLECMALLIQGQVANNIFRHEDALACYEAVLPLAEELKDSQCEAAAYILGAEARYGLGRMDLATELAGKAAPIAAKVGDSAIQERCKRFVSIAIRGRGGGGGGKRRRKIGTKKVKKMVEKRIGGGGTGTVALQLSAVKDMSMGVLSNLSEEKIGFDDPLMDSGIDSLSAVQFRNELTKQTGMKLPGTLMFDYPTLGAVADFIVETSAGAGDSAGGEAERIEMVEEEVEESEYEWVSDDEDYQPRTRRRKIGTKKVKKWVQKQVGGGAVAGGGGGLQLSAVKDMSMTVLSSLSEEKVGFDDPLMDSGIDSLSAVQFRNELTKSTGMKLPGTLMFDYPTLGAVAEFIVETSGGAGGGEGNDGPPKLEWVEEEVEESEYEDIEDDFAPPVERRAIEATPVAAKAPAPEAKKGLELESVKILVKEVINNLAESEVGYDDPLMDSGLDSLAAVQFRNDLTKQTGMKLPGTVMFDFPSMGAIAQFIVDESLAIAN